MFCSVGFTAIHVSQRLHPQWWQRCFATASEWKSWQRRCDRLTKLQQRIKFPQPTFVTVEGIAYALPLKAVDPPKQEPTQEELQYLVGFFDGDGCVSMRSQSGQISLSVCQSIDAAQILLLLRDKLGGGVSRHCNRTGLHKACLIWQACGSTVHHAALLLSRVPSMKQQELQIAAGARIQNADRAKVAEQLKFFKRKDYSPTSLALTWPQFAGFFDAEGSVSVHAFSVGLQLRIGQVNPCLLKHLQTFLHNNGLEKWNLYECKNITRLTCKDLETAKRTLELLLSSGLRLKKMQAKLALSLNASNHQQVRKDIMDLNGWQGRYIRLDEEGSLLAKRIHALRKKSNRISCQKEREQAGSQIQHLKEELAFHKVVCRCRYLRTHIRQSLSEGGFLLPTWNCSQREASDPDMLLHCYIGAVLHCIDAPRNSEDAGAWSCSGAVLNMRAWQKV